MNDEDGSGVAATVLNLYEMKTLKFLSDKLRFFTPHTLADNAGRLLRKIAEREAERRKDIFGFFLIPGGEHDGDRKSEHAAEV